ncbi:hypothetical protein [Hyalangium versicolor]|uniref:hypothetical protein n=1 Tax=Hyalangium versicolor TaxID=2861190 RepID=UPI001CCB346E|nr:hypothetical protein [Hyalangium versicolor]
MHLRKTLGAVALMATAMVGCSGRDEPPTDGGPDDGCTGVCSDGGTQSDGGTDGGADAGPRVCPAADNQGRGPIGQIRANAKQGDAVKLEHLVVVAVDDLTKGGQGDYISQFWVVDPCFPKEGIWIDKYYTDVPKPYAAKVGDELTIEGLFRHINPIGSDVNTVTSNAQEKTRDAYRASIKSAFQIGDPNIKGNLIITQTGTATVPADNTVPAGFGNSDGGTLQPNPEYMGARVHIPGPISITNANPPALKQRPDDPTNDVYLGFEVTGGVLVSNYKTFGVTFDGGTPRCDWRNVVNDGGTVTFTNGIRGVWDSYSFVGCADGGFTNPNDGGTYPSCSYAFRDAGMIPGTDNPYTHILYAQDCATDLPGTASP